MLHKTVTTAAIVGVILSFCFPAHAQQSMDHTSCPMMGNMVEMKSDMQSMMEMTSDPAMKERMQKMHDDMGSMMQHMADMHKGMGGMMHGGEPAEMSHEGHEEHQHPH